MRSKPDRLLVSAKGLACSVGGREIIGGAGGLDLTIKAGEFAVVAGVNGAGKTTLLKLLSGELHPTRGSVHWREAASMNRGHGKPPGIREMALRRAYLAQQTMCALPFRALEVVLFGAEAGGASAARAVQVAWEAMAKTGTRHLAERSMETLSGGEAQRVHWARVLAQIGSRAEGKVLFLDEPISSLDVAHQHDLLTLAQSYARAGAAVVAVLHDLNLASEYADRLLFLHRGALYREGSPEETLTPETLHEVYGIAARVVPSPTSGRPFLFVQKRGLANPHN